MIYIWSQMWRDSSTSLRNCPKKFFLVFVFIYTGRKWSKWSYWRHRNCWTSRKHRTSRSIWPTGCQGNFFCWLVVASPSFFLSVLAYRLFDHVLTLQSFYSYLFQKFLKLCCCINVCKKFLHGSPIGLNDLLDNIGYWWCVVSLLANH